ncbi:hypothetical protein [Vitiosangium sp. GDMCC 1.1324]|uniref:hypothetical protein n=1 Tax=Vitiosangium sp. (strain GDMCC 1.1324) TaxID=2138576 RepID=UPI0011B3841A|nr:hypothetical protein [Vitiosangium sp. GDMCC 1.1324]
MPDSGELASQTREVVAANGLSFNGLSFNGLSFNGLSFNGLSSNGLSSPAFDSWFQSNPSLADQVMKYVVTCAVPQGQSRTYTAPATGVSYTWQGSLGLAPGWANGAPATLAEQQVISGCLVAHANKYGIHLPISVMGRTAVGTALPIAQDETSQFPMREGCFFGNLFNGEGVFVGSFGTSMDTRQSSTRPCAFTESYDSTRPREQCQPLVFAGSCEQMCTYDATGKFFTSCTVNGRSYLPMTTRMRTQDVYSCGDGTCQPSEKCGTSNTYSSCGTDCGACP